MTKRYEIERVTGSAGFEREEHVAYVDAEDAVAALNSEGLPDGWVARASDGPVELCEDGSERQLEAAWAHNPKYKGTRHVDAYSATEIPSHPDEP